MPAAAGPSFQLEKTPGGRTPSKQKEYTKEEEDMISRK